MSTHHKQHNILMICLLTLLLAMILPASAVAGAPACPSCGRTMDITYWVGTYYRFEDSSVHAYHEGQYYYHCSVCETDSGYTLEHEVYQPHTFLDGVCTKCGYNNGTGETSSIYLPNSFNPGSVNRKFPARYIRDTTARRISDRGIVIGLLGITGSKGANVRSFPRIGNNSEKLKTLHAGETVYIYYSVNDGWYYIVCSDGTEGYVSSSMVQVTDIRVADSKP